MSLVTNLQSAFTRVATEFKTIRTFISGSGTGDTTGLSTTSKNLVGAVNELYSRPISAGALSGLSDVTLTTPAATNLLQYDGTKWVNGSATQFQAADSDLTAIAALTTTSYGRAFLSLANQAALMALMSGATETAAGDIAIATQTETNAGAVDSKAVTPLKLQTRLAAYAQPLDSDLTAIAALATTTFGRSLLTQADAAGTKATLGLAAIATSGSASDITTGTLPTSVLPPLAINDTFTVVSQAAMLALTAQRGDMAIRTDNGRTYVLATDSPATLADWKEVMAAGQVQSVSGKTGVVVLTAGDVGLGNVTNVAQQPLDGTLTALAGLTTAVNQMIYSTGADTFAMTVLTPFARTLLDDTDQATAQATLGVYSQTQIGDPNTDFVATFVAGLA